MCYIFFFLVKIINIKISDYYVFINWKLHSYLYLNYDQYKNVQTCIQRNVTKKTVLILGTWTLDLDLRRVDNSLGLE